MDIFKFVKLLIRNWWKIILIPLITLVLCYFLVKELPSEYESHGSVATGLVDKSEEILTIGEKDQEVEINRKFDNLIQMMKLKKVLDLVSYKLLLHDLQVKPEERFKDKLDALDEMTASNKKKYILVLKQRSANRQELLPGSKEDDFLIALLKEIGYDYNAIEDYINIFRKGNSDYIALTAVANKPQLSEFLINTLCTEFIAFYSLRISDNNTKAIDFLTDFLKNKRQALTEKMNTLREFKIGNRVLNLNEQARSLYGQISEYEAKREIAAKDIISYTAAIAKIDNKFDPKERKYIENVIAELNQNILSSKQQIYQINAQYIRSNFDPTLKITLDSLRKKLVQQINESSDQYLYNPLSFKTTLVNQKLGLEIQLELSKNSVKSIKDELERLNIKFDELVPNEAQIQEFETGIEIATDEYMEALQRYNDVTFASSFPAQLKQVEKAFPGTIKPSKKILILGMSGIVSFIFCLLFYFVLFYFDKSIRDVQELANESQLPVIGYLNYVSNVSHVFDSPSSKGSSTDLYQKLLRSLRYEIDELLPDSKIITFTSLKTGEGKSAIVYGLAKMFLLVKKRVLIIDGNFSDQSITNSTNATTFLDNLAANERTDTLGEFDVIGNNGGDISLFEMMTDSQIVNFEKTIRSKYDIILIEAEALSAMNKVKEWISISDLVVAVFASGNTFKTGDLPKLMYLKSLNNQFGGWVLNGIKGVNEPIE